MSVHNFAPKRYIVEVSEDEHTMSRLLDVTGREKLVYFKGEESPWVGFPIEDIEKWAKEGEYGFGIKQFNLMAQIQAAKEGYSVPKDEDEI